MLEAKKISKLLKQKKIKTEELQKILSERYNIKLSISMLRKYRATSVDIPPTTLTALAEILDVTEQEFFIQSYWKKRKIAGEILNNELIEIFYENNKDSFFFDKNQIPQNYLSEKILAKKNDDNSTTIYSPTLSKDILKILPLS